MRARTDPRSRPRLVASADGWPAAAAPRRRPWAASPATAARHGRRHGIHRIRHVVVLMQENRSFDSYFGTFPGRRRAPARNGRFTVCVPDPRAHSCAGRFTIPAQVNGGGQHNADSAQADMDGGRMDGFVRVQERPGGRGCGDDRGGLRVIGAPGRDGLPRRPRDPELLALGPRLHAAGPHVRAERIVEPARRTCSWSRSGRPAAAAGTTRRAA